MKPIKSSEMPAFFLFIVFFASASVAAWAANVSIMRVYIFAIWTTVALILLYDRWVVYYLTPDGIQRKYMGLFPMKTISWKEIRDVARVPARNGTLLLASTVYVRYPMPDKNNAYPKGLKAECERYKLRAFYLKDTPEILDCICKYHGKLSNYEPRR